MACQFLVGIPEYNCYINPAKTVTNVAVQEDGSVKVLEEGIYSMPDHLSIPTGNSGYILPFCAIFSAVGSVVWSASQHTDTRRAVRLCQIYKEK